MLITENKTTKIKQVKQVQAKRDKPCTQMSRVDAMVPMDTDCAAKIRKAEWTLRCVVYIFSQSIKLIHSHYE